MTTLYLDLETVPADAYPGFPQSHPGVWLAPEWAFEATAPTDAKALQLARAQFKRDPAWVGRFDQALVDWAARASKEWADGSKDPLRARIVCACVSVDGAEVSQFSGETAEIRLWSCLDRLLCHNGPYEYPTLVAYNCGFDRQIAFARALKAGFPGAANVLANAHWEDPGEFWHKLGSRWYPAHHHSLGDLCKFMGIPHDDTFTGADVLPAYVAGDLRNIVDHCVDDVRALVLLHRALNLAGPLPSRVDEALSSGSFPTDMFTEVKS